MSTDPLAPLRAWQLELYRLSGLATTQGPTDGARIAVREMRQAITKMLLTRNKIKRDNARRAVGGT